MTKEFQNKVEKVEDMSRTINAKLSFDQIHAVTLDQNLRIAETREICETIMKPNVERTLDLQTRLQDFGLRFQKELQQM